MASLRGMTQDECGFVKTLVHLPIAIPTRPNQANLKNLPGWNEVTSQGLLERG